MTNKEAISNLEHIYGIVSPDIQRSLDLAIKALADQESLAEAYARGYTEGAFYGFLLDAESEEAEE